MLCKSIHEFPILWVGIFVPCVSDIACLCVDKLHLGVPFANNSICNLPWGWKDLAIEPEISILRPSSFVEFNLDVLGVGTSCVSHISSITCINIRLTYDQIVNTHGWRLELKPLIEVLKGQIFFKHIGEGESATTEFVLRSIHWLSCVAFIP